MTGWTTTQTTWVVREGTRRPLNPGRESPMAGNTRPILERAGDREKALESALLQIERQFGKGSVMRLGEETRVPVEVIRLVRSRWTLRWASAACRAAASSRYTDRRRPA